MEKWPRLLPFSLLSLAWYRFNRQGRALILIRKARENLRQRRILQAIPFALAGGILAPEVAFYTVFYPQMKDFAHRVLLQGKTGVTVSREYPLVSVVTPSYNQGLYIKATIQSVLNQDYPRIEHIVVDGGSTDETLSILKKYLHLKWISEPDRGQSHAINKGFQMATGEIIAWLNSDDTYLPGAVTAAVETLDKRKGRYIVMGQCPFIDEKGNPTGVFHPSAYRSRRDLVKIWKGLYSIPQPTVFFFRELIDEFGGLDESLYFAMDYEIWLRFSKKCRFTLIKKPLATYRLHEKSKTMETSEQELLKKTVGISRRYWGPKNSPSYWYYYLSYRLSQIFLWRISNRYWNRSADYYNQKKWFRAAFYLLIALSLYPPTILRKKYVFSYLIKTWISEKIGGYFDQFMHRPDPSKCDGMVHSDGWVSDYATLPLDISPSVKRLEIVGDAHLRFFGNSPLSIKVFLNNSFIEERAVEQSGEFRIAVDLRNHPTPPKIEIRLYPDKIFIPRALGEGPDKRRLSFIYKGIISLKNGDEV